MCTDIKMQTAMLDLNQNMEVTELALCRNVLISRQLHNMEAIIAIN